MKEKVSEKRRAGLRPLPASLSEVLQQLVRQEENSPLSHPGRRYLPSLEEVVVAMRLFRRVLFPDHALSSQERTRARGLVLAENLSTLLETLSEQVYLALRFAGLNGRQPDELRDEGRQRALRVLRRLPALLSALEKDVEAAYEGDPAATGHDEVVLCYPGFQAVFHYRIAHELHRVGIPFLPRMVTEYAHSVTGADIHPEAEIGESFFIDHATGVVIGQTTRIGNRVRIYQGVTLGALTIGKSEDGRVLRGAKRHPTVEDEVVIYANATILGGKVVIGRGATVGGSCWITRSIDPGTRIQIGAQQLRSRREDVHVPDWSI